MGLVSKTVKVKWHVNNKYHYESHGYIFTRFKDEFEVRIDDLTKGTETKVRCKCDNDECGKEFSQPYNNYRKYVKEDGKTYCFECACKLYGGKNSVKTKLKNSQSFYDWCIINERKDILDRWDYELNGCSPKDITYRTSKKYWFKCNKHPEHKSELKIIATFTRGNEGAMKCVQCNSFAQYLLDNFPDKEIGDYWDYKRNTFDPWEIPSQKNEKVWIKCQEKDYHGSYEIVCNSFVNGNRCPYCNNNSGKVHPKDSLGQYIIDNYGEEFLNNIWSDKNDKTAFEYTHKTNKKVWWKCLDGIHNDYFRSVGGSFVSEFRCPKCVEEMNCSVIEKKTKDYLELLGYEVLTEHNCTIRAINPKNKHPMPYDNEIILLNGRHLIIEVHGEQHYIEHTGYFKGGLKQRQLYDRYKKYIAWKNNYEYLELPYTSFEGDNKDQYKQIIDNKIKEILRKVG